MAHAVKWRSSGVDPISPRVKIVYSVAVTDLSDLPDLPIRSPDLPGSPRIPPDPPGSPRMCSACAVSPFVLSTKRTAQHSISS